MNNNRRLVIKGGVLLGASSVIQGCAVFDFLSRSRTRVEPITCNETMNPVVDAHAHFFNGTDLLAGQYLTGPVAGDLVNYYNISLIRVFMKLAGRAVQRLATSLSLTASKELTYLESNKDKLAGLRERRIFSYYEHGYQEASEAFYEVLTEEERAELQQAILEYEANRNAILKETLTPIELNSLERVKLDRAFLFNAIAGESAESKGTKSTKLAVDKLNFLSIDVLAAFVLRMLSKRSSNLAEYQSVFSAADAGPSIVNVTDVTVDFDYWLSGCEEEYSSTIASQVILHEALHRITEGYTIPLLGVNPMKLIVRGKTYLDFIEDTLKKGFYRGVKIYPTHGFSPNGELYPNFEKYIRLCDVNAYPNEKSVQEALVEIYTLCKQYNAVVMAHSDKSKGFPKNAAAFGGPSYWKKVFDINGLHDLKVNFGHLGEFKSSKDANWTSEFLELMRVGNRYGDLGFWFTQDSKALTKRLFRELKMIGDETLYERILYGSDWFMLTSQPSWKPYLDRANHYFNEMINENMFGSDDIGQQAKNQFFYLNAQRLFDGSVATC
ncbi:amidohydrolase family protein [Bowmanella sp. Y26]|uniref:amidohydrolase family protein n=1 Tax=Bowmanella yangjiangensis TaxID=2811230 RepID=UPI001BDC79D1|nr:amidohydrolase family protein [Bowmanella yangjiangensis]MBT1063990.1 amidohydrolase family protein [Bowmanella yangjiangensis]